MITIKVLTRDGNVLAESIETVFDDRGGTIGRAEGNALVLADPNRYISRVQASIDARDGQYLIRNLGSGNPIAVNGSLIESGSEAPLTRGDKIEIGSYTLKVVALAADISTRHPSSTTEGTKASAVGRPKSPDLGSGVPGTIARWNEDLLRAFLNGAGVPDLQVPGGMTSALMSTVGQLLRTTIQGTVDLIQSKQASKRNVRADATVIVASDVNPIEFSWSPENAIKELLIPRGRGYMKAIPAIQAAFHKLRAQEVATKAGMHAALSSVLVQFDPRELEKRLTSDTLPIDSSMSSTDRASIVDLIVDRYAEIARESEKQFTQVFEAEFGKAYDAEMAASRSETHTGSDTDATGGAIKGRPHGRGAALDSLFELSPPHEGASSATDPFAAPPSALDPLDLLPEEFDPFAIVAPRPIGFPPRPFEQTPTPSSPAKDDVKMGAAAPDSAVPGERFVAHFVAYPANHEDEVRLIIASQSPSVIPVLGKRSCRWARGASVTVKACADNIEIEHSEQSFEWNGAVESLDFCVKVKEDAPSGNVVLKYEVFVDAFFVAVLCLTIRISAKETHGGSVVATASAPRTAFASYSSDDRPLVTHMVGAIERSAGIAVFQDCLDLKASEEWKPKLDREIADRDLFFLFWSKAASTSQWVEWEWKTALRCKGKEAMQLYPLQPDLRPPDGLSALHCSSVHAIVAEFYSTQHRRGAEPTP